MALEIRKPKDVSTRPVHSGVFYQEDGWVIHVLRGGTLGEQILTDEGTWLIGRNDEQVDLVLSDKTVSRVHAKLEWGTDGAHLTPLTSSNSTLVGRRTLKGGERYQLRYGDHVYLGEAEIQITSPLSREACQRDVELEAARREGKLVSSVVDGQKCDLHLRSEAMQSAYKRLARHASFDTSVLILGATGTGKEVAASTLHHWSSRNAGPFVPVNCGALPGNLVESELFGHVKGAFSGANSDKKGLIEEAHEGTLFLDEIGELGLETQVKLLRVLETGQVRRVGDTRHKAIDFRLVCATNRDLYERTSDGLFREDLYYRIAVAKVHLPALRHRPEDIGPLAHSFLERYCAQARRPTIALSEEALAALREQRWSGNIRELRNWMQRAVTEFDEVELKAEHILTLAEDAWLAADFPLEEAALATIADQAVARLERDQND
jgi:DNA-binding NtrC family response regulator